MKFNEDLIKTFTSTVLKNTTLLILGDIFWTTEQPFQLLTFELKQKENLMLVYVVPNKLFQKINKYFTNMPSTNSC